MRRTDPFAWAEERVAYGTQWESMTMGAEIRDLRKGCIPNIADNI
jgi:hypothetical protein